MYLKILSWYEIPSYRMQEISLVTLSITAKKRLRKLSTNISVPLMGEPKLGRLSWGETYFSHDAVFDYLSYV